MKKLFIALSLVTFFSLESSAQWKPAGDKIKTEWAEQIDPSNVLPEYPRPIMQRNDWKNLNGCGITPLLIKVGIFRLILKVKYLCRLLWNLLCRELARG